MKQDLKSALDRAKERRFNVMVRMHKNGKTVEDISLHFQISRARTHQIFKEGGYQAVRQPRYCGRTKQ